MHAPETAPADPNQPDLKKDLLASVVVFLVALPLCMGIAIASGVPPELGLITGVVGGFVIGSLAGSPMQVSGPAAGLAVIVWEIVNTHGLAVLGVIVLAAGAIQLGAGLLKLGQWFRAVSPAVVQGMLAGIGVLIFASQFHVMLDDKPQANGLTNLATIPSAIVKGIFPMDGSVHHQAAAVGILTIAALVCWNLFAPKRLSVIPGALVGVVAAVIFATAAGLGVARVQVPTDLVSNLQIGGTLGNLGLLANTSILISVVTMALVASAETMLCATATDRLHTGQRTNYDRELVAQGVGNMVCGLFGALPATGVIVRSTANIEAGGTTRRSAIIHGFWLLLFVVALPFVLGWIPVAALAAILVHIGYKLVNPKGIRALYEKQGAGELAVFAVTLVAIVATNLLTGIIIGFGLAAFKLFYRATRLRVEVSGTNAERVDVQLIGAATFVGLPVLARAVEEIPMQTHVEIHLDGLTYADAAIMDFLTGYEQRHVQLGGSVHVCWDTLRQLRASSARTPEQEESRSARLAETAEREAALASSS